ncbi:MAG TPA: Holliday junction branch migration protein RuvA [Dehalococcoidia bacterium]|jgi:Holliday junction DNA helicase RuvA|nr:Holliday junction branch migration protein RuvA [Dehalococcoidia bacterium]
MPLARLRGTIEETGDGWVIVGVGGVGLLASVPTPTAEALAPGEQARLYTYLHVREDALVLYGFARHEELALFEQLIAVSGVGPKAALALLSAVDCARLAAAIVSGQADLLRRVPGIGQKTAERIILELRDKVAPPAEEPAPPAKAEAEKDTEVIAALQALGYTQAEASAAAAHLEDGRDQPLEDRIRRALQHFTA